MTTWHSMDTAPRDGTPILITCGRIVEMAYWSPNIFGPHYPWVFASDTSCYEKEHDTWTTEVNAFDAETVTHWMPLPSPPEATK